ncbi:MAG: queuosine precursor transporter [Bacteroidales bacterium]|nr:queuosine precursor transporter [Bacteroidales bacterium]
MLKSSRSDHHRSNTLFLVLAAFFITNAIIAEFGGVKIFSMEKLLGMAPLNLRFLGSEISLNMSVGVLIWPLVFIISDLMNEYFGRSGVRKISFLTAAMIGYGFVIILGWTKMPAADFWLNLNGLDAQGNKFNIDYAYSLIFRQGLGIIVGSLTAFLVSQLVDAYVFHYFRKLTGHKYLWLRATGSTAISQLIDSFVILVIAFYFLGNWSLEQVLKVGLIQYSYKLVLAILLTPLIYLAHFIIDRYLGKSRSIQLIEETNRNW